ncbi:ATPase [Diaporthe helianthi]|uniref:ATPase n=1 Tax=Diaporthe helianthi TaxID=158607 RepID=A0A2P5IFX0_DIAHE|nr:ATPase [Diaporthe helianthi]
MAVSQTASSASDQINYILPNWFLEQNVTTSKDLESIKPETIRELHQKTFTELCDATCASFVPQNGRLNKDSTIVFRMEEPGTRRFMLEPAWMRRAIMQSAKSSEGISLIQLDLESLEELGSEFHQQDMQRAGKRSTGWEPNVESFTTFLERFFAIPAKANADKEAWKRRHQSLSTVLDAVATARLARMQDGDGNDAVLVHIMMDSSSANEILEQRVLERFAEMVRGRREDGQALTIILSTKSLSYLPGTKHFQSIGGTQALSVTAICDELLDSNRQERIRNGIINTQRLRRLLRLRLPANKFSAELLTCSSDWAAADRGKTYQSFGETLWSISDMNKVITLLTGRIWKQKGSKSPKTFADISVVLEYLDLFRQVEVEEKAESQTTEPSDTASGDSQHSPQSRGSQQSLSPATTPPDSDSDDESRGWTNVASQTDQEWTQQKSQEKQNNAVLDSLMSLVGMEGPKSQFMAIKNLVTTARRQNVGMEQQRFGAVFVGGPGSGKTTVAELYADFLSSLQIVSPFSLVKTTGARLASGGVSQVRTTIKSLEKAERHQNPRSQKMAQGIILIDNAHDLVSFAEHKETSTYLMDEVQRLQGDVIFLFAGTHDALQSLMGMSPLFRTYFPFTFTFEDFTNSELHQILTRQLISKFRGLMRVEGGTNGIFMKVLTRRISRGRGSSGFANALEVQNALSRVLIRQAERLSHSRRIRQNADDMLLTGTDLVGPPPSSTLNSTAWKNLRNMTGLESVKKSVQALVTRLQTNYEREMAEMPLLETSLNKVFLGGPGTGKTTVAKYYGQILKDLGFLTSGDVIFKTSQDFIGERLGESETKTREILDSAKGKVLIIDEAYGLGADKRYGCIIDTIVGQVQANSTEDRAVLLLGYKAEIEELFRKVNPGLSRRFPISSGFQFHDFTDEELCLILEKKLKAQGFVASVQAKQVAMDVLSRARNRANFGNAGEVDILLDRAKEAQQMRLGESKSIGDLTELKEVDFDPEFDRKGRAESNIKDDFSDFVGADALVAKFQGYQRIAQNAKAMGLDPKELIPFSFVFRGPPGTGKTTAARKLGRIFFDMGFLATSEVEVCSATELVSEYHGRTGHMTKGVFEKALGKVLLIDEAYRLGEADYICEGRRRTSHKKEALDEMVNLLTLPKYKNNIVVILAGYDREMNQLLGTNPGLGSRFPEVVQFSNMSPEHCYELFLRLLQDKKLGVGSLQLSPVAAEVQAQFQTLSNLPSWGNARDVESLAKSLFGRMLSVQVVAPTPPSSSLGSLTSSLFGRVLSCQAGASPPSLDVDVEWVHDELEKMIAEREKRAEDTC